MTRDSKFLGLLLTPDGMNVDPKKADAFRQMDSLQCERELESFQAIVNYLKCYSNHIKYLSELLKKLMRNNTLWCWESKHQKAFEASKDELIKPLY